METTGAPTSAELTIGEVLHEWDKDMPLISTGSATQDRYGH
ncbi:hypothetical protein [Streptomyces sp. ISL-96]|nr:hypothetical protein [Streptomyces sp. ISL-96]